MTSPRRVGHEVAMALVETERDAVSLRKDRRIGRVNAKLGGNLPCRDAGEILRDDLVLLFLNEARSTHPRTSSISAHANSTTRMTRPMLPRVSKVMTPPLHARGWG